MNKIIQKFIALNSGRSSVKALVDVVLSCQRLGDDFNRCPIVKPRYLTYYTGGILRTNRLGLSKPSSSPLAIGGRLGQERAGVPLQLVSFILINRIAVQFFRE